MQGESGEARRLHCQQTVAISRISKSLKVGTFDNAVRVNVMEGELIWNSNFSIGGSCVFDSHSSESVVTTLYEDSCETDSNDSTIYNKSRSGYPYMLN